MIVNIRGTSGSGKSFLVREVMKRCGSVEPEREAISSKDTLFGPAVTTASNPVGYLCTTPQQSLVWIAGSYEMQSGGCDDLMKTEVYGSRDAIYALVEERAKLADVLYEGLLICEVHRLVALSQRYPKQVLSLQLSTPVDECLEAIRTRRAAKGNFTPLSPTATSDKHRELQRQMARLEDAGVDIRLVTREEALALTLETLGWL